MNTKNYDTALEEKKLQYHFRPTWGAHQKRLNLGSSKSWFQLPILNQKKKKKKEVFSTYCPYRFKIEIFFITRRTRTRGFCYIQDHPISQNHSTKETQGYKKLFPLSLPLSSTWFDLFELNPKTPVLEIDQFAIWFHVHSSIGNFGDFEAISIFEYLLSFAKWV